MPQSQERRKDHGAKIQRFLGYLQSQAENRGMMADLRHGISSATEYRAWPHIAPWCRDFGDDDERRIMLTVGAGFATHQRTSPGTGNMGAVLRSIATGDGRGVEGLSTFDARFRRLLACSDAPEVCDHLPGVLRAAGRRGVPVDFGLLHSDLIRWGERVKVAWARAYWAESPEEEQGAEEAEEEL